MKKKRKQKGKELAIVLLSIMIIEALLYIFN